MPKKVTVGRGGGGRGLFGGARSAILGLLLLRPDERFHLRQVARLAGTGLGPTQRELAALVGLGLVRREPSGQQVMFAADPSSPIFGELRSILTKTTGVADVIRAALGDVAGQIEVAFIFGSVAAGTQGSASDVDLLVIADPRRLSFGALARALAPAQGRLARDVNPTYYSPREFAARRSAGHHFVTDVLAGPKVFVIGDEHELERVGQKRVDPPARAERRRVRKALPRDPA